MSIFLHLMVYWYYFTQHCSTVTLYFIKLIDLHWAVWKWIYTERIYIYAIIPCSNDRINCVFFLWAEFRITGIDTPGNLQHMKKCQHHSEKSMIIINKVPHMCAFVYQCKWVLFDQGRGRFRSIYLRTWPSAMITNTWYCPPVLSTISTAASTTGPYDVGPWT